MQFVVILVAGFVGGSSVGITRMLPLMTLPDLVSAAPAPAVRVAGDLPGDCNGDGVVDNADFVTLSDCLSGPGVPATGKNCACVDFESDLDVDLFDVAEFQNFFNPFPVTASCGLGTNSCFQAGRIAGCAQAECCALVCTVDDYCCVTQWDDLCVNTALLICPDAPVVENDDCADSAAIIDGTTSFSNVGATTDGPEETGMCGDVSIGADIWYCHAASCTGILIVSLCGSSFDTTLAVYDVCSCPVGTALACSDDDCGFGLESRATLAVTKGQSLMIRVGGFRDEVSGITRTGTGRITLICGPDETNSQVCSPGQGDCLMGHELPGCDETACCLTVCEVDPFCCDVQWDDFCSREGAGLCEGNFDSCGAKGTGSCNFGGSVPGCDNVDCCNAVCADDPYCCLVRWDGSCAGTALGNPACK